MSQIAWSMISLLLLLKLAQFKRAYQAIFKQSSFEHIVFTLTRRMLLKNFLKIS